ncbi:hypothetical protein [Streptomyces cavernae]|uniref:hypothetical protein n=1 Tax=Streptomyces cavernae TaxID=2259034 RepID=UPI000FEBB9C4|nr:hypothetical protein [Streptomyces cavernae]
MNGISGVATPAHDTSWRHFARHYFEMVAAMLLGMVVLGPVWRLALSLLGPSDARNYAELVALVMATNMTIGMSVWMRHRGHGWASIGEMAVAMYLPFVVLFGPYWAGLISGGTMLFAGHIIMLPCMFIVMLRRRDEYSRDHRRHTTRHDRSAERLAA